MASHLAYLLAALAPFLLTKFKNALLDYYRANTRKQRKGLLPLDDFEFPVFSAYDIKIDYQVILDEMSELGAIIFDKIYSKGWRQQEIQNHLNITASRFDREISGIRKVIKQYSDQQL